MREFVRIAPAGDDAGQPVRRAEMLRDLGPALRQPVLFRAGGAGMEYRERAGDAVRAEDFFRLRSGAFRHAQFGQRRGFDACHGGGEVEVMIDRVPLAHRRSDEAVKGDGAQFRLFHPLESHALFRP